MDSHLTGLSQREAAERLRRLGPNTLHPPQRGRGLRLLLAQFKSPLVLLLIGAAVLSLFLGDAVDVSIILAIVFLSGILGFFQERGALNALEKLMAMVETTTAVVRDGQEREIPSSQIVVDDVVIFRAGDLVTADCTILETTQCFANEAALTGESESVEKNASEFLRCGTQIASGIAKAVVTATGTGTQYSALVERLRFRPPETAFEMGVRKFGFFLLELTLVLVLGIFALNVLLEKSVIQSLLFSLALAVGLTPQLLPAIISVNLSHGARRMASKKVVVKRLASLENFGQMDVLCVDKTGTLTLGKMEFCGALGVNGKPSDKGALYAFLNAHFQAGYANPLDQAILAGSDGNAAGWRKLREIPYDFTRRRLSVVVEREGTQVLITKGAVSEVFALCESCELEDGRIEPFKAHSEALHRFFEQQSAQGLRLLALAYGATDSEQALTFLGFLVFYDPVKPDVARASEVLQRRGVRLKMITGDHPTVALFVARAIGLTHRALITGAELSAAPPHVWPHLVRQKDIFAEVQPQQKEQLILALRHAGHVVGFLGDGVNDVAALHSADVGISVNTGADAAKEASDIVLLEKDLGVLSEGIEEGRRTFVNTLKYVYMATSANFGNMFSMAGASLFLPFLPLLPKQVLLTNFLSDLPEMALASDRVDPERLYHPVKWDLPRIKRFMVVFGLISSVFDFLTFGALLWWFGREAALFQSGWFLESVISAALVALVIRTRRGSFRSRPGRWLLVAVLGVVVLTPLMPWTPLGELFGLRALPPSFYLVVAGIVAAYLASVEVAKYFFFRK